MAILNQTLARYYFGSRDPVGQRITLDHVTLRNEPVTYEIIGVAGDANYMEIQEPERRVIYLTGFTSNTLVVRTQQPPGSMAQAVRSAIHEAAPAIAVSSVTTLEDQIEATIVPQRLIAMLSGFFGGLGALLAGVGLYGLLAYRVTRRTSEFGIRLALGCSPSGLIRMVVKEAGWMVGVGWLAALPLLVAANSVAARVSESVAQDGSRLAMAVGVSSVTLLAIAGVAAWIPARRASRVDPAESLRHE